MEQLKHIQAELKAPKNQRNTFGNYNYRSCEDILEAVKPLLNTYNCTLTISDEIECIGGRVYVKAIATLRSLDGASVSASAYAREPETKKGMDESQITGATSSYARKYALNGLFAIDDTKDADASHTNDKPQQSAQPTKQNKPTNTPVIEEKHRKALYASYKSKNIADDAFKAMMKELTGKESSKELTMDEFKKLMKYLEEYKEG